MRRRMLLLAGAGSVLFPLHGFAQAARQPLRIGLLALRKRPVSLQEDDYTQRFHRGMRELGYLEGRSYAIEYRFADDRADALPALAAELVQLKVDVIIAHGTLSSQVAKRVTSAIPIVMVNVGNPAGMGLVESLGRPGGNATGLSTMTGDATGKQLELLTLVVPAMKTVGVLRNATNKSSEVNFAAAQQAVQKTGLRLVAGDARAPEDVENALVSLARERIEAMIVLADQMINAQEERIALYALRQRWPSIKAQRRYAEVGGLLAYGADFADNFRRAAGYVDRLARGAKAAELPVEQPTTLELVVNVRTAKAIGVRVSEELLLRANRVIE